MFKFKMSLLLKSAKFRVAVIVLAIAAIIAGIVCIPKNKARDIAKSACVRGMPTGVTVAGRAINVTECYPMVAGYETIFCIEQDASLSYKQYTNPINFANAQNYFTNYNSASWLLNNMYISNVTGTNGQTLLLTNLGNIVTSESVKANVKSKYGYDGTNVTTQKILGLQNKNIGGQQFNRNAIETVEQIALWKYTKNANNNVSDAYSNPNNLFENANLTADEQTTLKYLYYALITIADSKAGVSTPSTISNVVTLNKNNAKFNEENYLVGPYYLESNGVKLTSYNFGGNYPITITVTKNDGTTAQLGAESVNKNNDGSFYINLAQFKDNAKKVDFTISNVLATITTDVHVLEGGAEQNLITIEKNVTPGVLSESKNIEITKPSGEYSVELIKVDSNGKTITSSEATFDINGKQQNTSNGVLAVVTKKTIGNVDQKDTYTIKETAAPQGYDAYEGTVSLNVQFKQEGKKFIIDDSKTTCTAPGQTGKIFDVSPDHTKITIYVKNNKGVKIHKGVKSVENQDSGYMYEDLKTGKKYTEDQLSKVMHRWVIETSIEDQIEKYKKYIITDKVDTTKLDFAGLDRVVVTLVDKNGSEKALTINKDYKLEYKDDVLKVSFIENDFMSETIKNAEVGSLQGYKFRVVFNTTFKVVDGKLAVLKDAVTNAENEATLTYNNGVGSDKTPKSEKPEVHTGAVSVFKYDDANGNGIHDNGEKALVGAEFKIAESKENAEAGKFVKDAEGNDLVAISNEHGVATFTGLEFGGDALANGTKQADGTFKYNWETASKDYYIVETKAPKGYLLMSEGVQVKVSKNSTECINLTDKMDAYANRAVNGTYSFTITKKDAETTKIIEDETTVFDIKVYSKVNEDGTFSEENLVNIVDINGKEINTKNIHAKTNGIVSLGNILIGEGEKAAGTYYFVIEETQAPDEYTEIDYRVVVPIKFELKENEYVAKHDTENSYALVKNDKGEVKKSLKEMASNNNECTSTEQVDVTINVNVPNKHKAFDLSLRKFITAINGVAPATSREPKVDTTKLASGEATTATYTHPKNPLDVATSDIVTYTLRVYNEGGIDGYAAQVMDDIPDGLEFIPGTETNKIWTMYKLATDSDKETVEFDGKKYVKTENAKEAKVIVTEALSMANNKDNLIKAFDGKTLSHKDLKVDFKVVEPNKSTRVITNYAQITKHSDRRGNTEITDRDSTPNKWNEGEDDQDIENIKLKEFDLSLRKFISAVNGIAPEKSREPVADTTKLASGEATTATYNHPKDALDVNQTDIVTYTLRVYNEGGVDGYAAQVMDDIPDGLEFIPGTETNKIWTMYRLAKDSDKETVEFDGKKYVKTENAKEAKVIVTEALSMANNKDNLIKAFDGKTLSYKDLKVDFKVVEPKTSDRIITNYAQVTKHTDRNGNVVTDRDSEPNKWNDGEDDQDIENIRVRYFDLSLLKYVTKAIVYENGGKNVTETGHTGYEQPEPVVKVDLKNTDINKVTVKFEYTIKIKNEGQIEGYAKEISDYIPAGLKFVPEDNKNWKEVDGKIVTDALKDTLLKPDESAEVTVILTWINGSDNMGVKTNVAEISKDYNKYGTPDIDSTPNNKVEGEDDIDNAPVMLTVRTGMPKQYYGVIFGVLVILTAGVVVIKKKVIA